MLICLFFQTSADLDSALRTFDTRLAAKNQTFQPQLIIVGNIASPEAVYVAYNKERRFQCASILSGLDLVFKSFFSLDVKYPEAVATIWLFIQQVIYGIVLQQDGRVPQQIIQLEGEVENFIKRTRQAQESTN